MRKLAAICILLASSHTGWACELPLDPTYYLEAMQEERSLTLQALAKSDLVLIGTVTKIRNGPQTSDLGGRESEVTVSVGQTLKGQSGQKTVALNAKLHSVMIPCFGNEAFWDDQVEEDGEYIFFVSNGHILSASPPARSWTRLGLAGQREVVLSAIRGGR